eukprot:CAMPEP_0179325750 /NCGR_PEP_ID=MMETSP0797-20121207/61060_1 /TAXON_ID=47934 /ORGANISM="Dinophysis acuminata, Strain DAEP01" /LENGTH=46 /DNA_ID= /DNA_START= /DNA_END= /DNA_ORIENTATION=
MGVCCAAGPERAAACVYRGVCATEQVGERAAAPSHVGMVIRDPCLP